MGRPKKDAAPKKAAKAKTKPEATETEAVATSSAFVLEDNIPLPARQRFGNTTPYPFASMGVNQSFIVEATVDADLYVNDDELGKAIVEEQRKIANRLGGAVRRFTKTHPDFKFAVRTVEGGVRVWRTE